MEWAAVLGAEISTSDGGAYARPVVTVTPDVWSRTVAAASEAGYDMFDWLSAVDEADGTFTLIVHVWSVSRREGVLIRATLPEPIADSVVATYPGANWHERETAEMFGIEFRGHPDPRKLLLAEEFDAHPLRKDFVLAARAVKPWPGAHEPGDREHGDGEATPARKQAPSRRKLIPPGVPETGWGRDA